VLGFDIEAEESLVAMAYCWGLKDQVAHVGISIMQLIPVIPPHKTGRELLIAHANEVRLYLQPFLFLSLDLKIL